MVGAKEELPRIVGTFRGFGGQLEGKQTNRNSPKNKFQNLPPHACLDARCRDARGANLTDVVRRYASHDGRKILAIIICNTSVYHHCFLLFGVMLIDHESKTQTQEYCTRCH